MIEDIKDATLEAQAEFMEIIREITQEMVTPQIKLMARAKWARMTPEQKEQFKTERPDEYRMFMEGDK